MANFFIPCAKRSDIVWGGNANCNGESLMGLLIEMQLYSTVLNQAPIIMYKYLRSYLLYSHHVRLMYRVKVE